ncbi:MAG: lipoate--protein ligase family protein [Parachlamydiales bacterium]|jgi:lipoate-protein ligase A
MLKVHLLHLQKVPIFQQLQIEEALLRADHRNWCIINAQASPAVVLGISGKKEELLNEEKIASLQVPLVRRFSGGGTVVIDESTCFATFIFNTGDCSFPAFPQQIMEWTDQFYSPIFPFKLHENDYVIGDRKCGGNAQYITKDRWLHHSSFLWDYSPHLMDCLLLPKRVPKYRLQRSHSDFLCTLKEYCSSPEDFQQKIFSQLRKQYTLLSVQIEEVLDILGQPHRKSTHLL